MNNSSQFLQHRSGGSAQVFLSLATTSTGSSQLWRPAAPQPRQAGLRRPPLPVPQVLPRRGISSRISKSMPSDRQQQRRLQAPSHQPVQQPRHLPRVQKLHSVNLVEATKLIAALHGGAQTQDIWLTLVSQDFESVPAPAIVNELLTDNYVKDSLVKEPASPAIPVKPKATSSSSSAAGK